MWKGRVVGGESGGRGEVKGEESMGIGMWWRWFGGKRRGEERRATRGRRRE